MSLRAGTARIGLQALAASPLFERLPLDEARLAGIDVFLHWTFPLLMGWVLFSQLAMGADWFAAWMHLAFVLSIFACVLLHELGHALAAREFGVPTKDITLLPIGGVARLERIPERPWHEFVIAIGGPLVNAVIASAIFIALVIVDAGKLWFGEIALGYFWQDLMWANVALVLFNLIPAFPMDGGRILRAALASRLKYSQATRIAATVGQVIAMLFVVVGLFVLNNPMLLR